MTVPMRGFLACQNHRSRTSFAVSVIQWRGPTQYVMERAFEAAGVDCRCLTFDVVADDLGDAIRGLGAMKFRGAWLASPHCESACDYILHVSDKAARWARRSAGVRGEDGLHGENTMGSGLPRLLEDAIDLTGKTAVVLGTGREARAAAFELTRAGMYQTDGLGRRPRPQRNLRPSCSVARLPRPSAHRVVRRLCRAGRDECGRLGDAHRA